MSVSYTHLDVYKRQRSTSENLRVEYIDPEKRLIGVRGAVPGIPGSVVEVVLV